MTIDEFIINLKSLNIEVTEEQILKLEQYYELLIEWNKKINLTGITEKKEVYLKHFYDSISLAKIIDLNKVNNLCDIGTGAGFPGIVLKIFYPDLEVILLDSLNKRTNFLNIVIEQLDLKKIKTITSRAEDYSKNNREIFDVVTARAVAPLSILLEYSIPLVKNNGYFIAMKADVSKELLNIDNCLKQLNIDLKEKEEFLLPFENSKRTLLKFEKKGKTENKYPRRYSEIKKRPL